MEKMQLKTMTVAIALGLLGGCASIEKAESGVKNTTGFAQQTFSQTQTKAAQGGQDTSRELMANFGKVQKNWVNPVPLKKSELFAERSRLPAFFKGNVSLTMPGRVSLVEVLSELQRSNKITFTIGQDVYNSSTGTGTIIGASGGAGAAAAPAGGTVNTSIGTNGAIPVYVNDFVFRGSLESALDLMSSKANVSWKWNGNSVEVYRFETKTYNIAALAGKTNSNSSVAIQGDSGTGDATSGNVGNKSTAGVNRSTDLNSWEDVRSYLLSMLSPSGSLAVMESAGIVTVKDTPAVQLHIAKAIKDLNTVIGQQIFMDVNIYAVTLNDEDNYSLNWNVAWQSMGQNFGLNIANSAPSVAGGNAISANIVRGPFTGSSVMFQALSSLGKTAVVNNFSFSTLNGQPTPVGNNRKISYVQSITAGKQLTGEAPPPPTITPGVVYQGIGMSVTPRLQQGTDKLLLEYSLSLNDVENIESFTTGTGPSAQTIQLPTTTVKNILQRASLRSGQTLVLSGFKQSTNSILKSGLGSANNQLLGGGNNGKNSSQYLVITVTPYIAQDNE
jgi:type IVB pilus formation R64 PilN family outer membrane protein